MSVRQFVFCGLVAASAVALAGCGESGPNAGQPTGTVHGMIMMTGGMPGASPISAAGTVIARRSGKQVSRQDVAEGQQFRFSLPAGVYQLSVRGVSGACVDTSVTVTASTDQAVSLVCQRK